MIRFIRSQLTAFATDRQGHVNAEAMIVLPLLLSLFGVGWVFFDAFRQQNVSQKANYTISDILSRQTDYIDGRFIDSTFNLFQTMTMDQKAEGSLRVSLVEYNGETSTWDTVWSKSRPVSSALDTQSSDVLEGRLPPAVNGEQLFVVETVDRYNPIFQVGLSAFDITTFSFTRPRYAAKAAAAE